MNEDLYSRWLSTLEIQVFLVVLFLGFSALLPLSIPTWFRWSLMMVDISGILFSALALRAQRVRQSLDVSA